MEWSSAYISALPDSAFACVDADGRHYPHHDAQGKLDLPHLRNALARVNQAGNTTCGKAHLQKHAEASMGKAQLPLKATLIDDDAFRLLALPFGGPIPYPGAPKGVDLDRQWLDEGTDFGRPPKRVDVTWHHGLDSKLGAEVIGKAGDLAFDDDGGWVTVWLDHGRRRTRLVKRLAEAAAGDPEVDIFGSSEAIPHTSRIHTGKAEIPWRRDIPGFISRWHYIGQTLSTSPQNTRSILVPLKATLTDLADGSIDPTADFFSDLTTFLDSLSPSSDVGKAGRVLAARNEARLREAREHIDEAYYDPKRRRAALRLLDDVFRELETFIHPDT